jgi:hypothetical protein
MLGLEMGVTVQPGKYRDHVPGQPAAGIGQNSSGTQEPLGYSTAPYEDTCPAASTKQVFSDGFFSPRGLARRLGKDFKSSIDAGRMLLLRVAN